MPSQSSSASVVHEWPRITLVTPSFNQAKFLGQTLDSVFSQEYPHLEYFVLDGGSTDGSLELIRSHAHRITWWVSERDGGQAAAIKRGLQRATGAWFNWINSDDLLAPNALATVARLASETPGTDLIAGTTVNFGGGRRRRRRPSIALDPASLIAQPRGSAARFHQPGTWLRTEYAREVGWDASLSFRFDLDLYLRYLRRHPKVCYTSAVPAEFRFHEQSKTWSGRKGFRREFDQILARLEQDPEWAELHQACRASRRAFRWCDTLEALEEGVATPRWSRCYTILRHMVADPEACRIPRSWRVLRKILFKGGRASATGAVVEAEV